MTTSTRCKWLIVPLAMLASVALVLGSNPQLLNEMLTKVAEARAEMDPIKLEHVSELGELIGQRRMRNFVLRLNLGPELRHLKSYNAEVYSQALRQTGDVDSVTEMLRKLAQKSDDQLAASSVSERAELIKEHLEPACRTFVEALRPVFEKQMDENEEQQLAEAIRENGLRGEVKQMIRTWADFGTCKTLLERDHKLLIDRIPKRIEDNKRIAARRLTRLV